MTREQGPPASSGDPGRDPVRATVRAVRSGDRDAFARLVERFGPRVHGITLMMTRDPADADAVTQETFVRAYENLDRFDEARPFFPWLATIAVRSAQNWLHRRDRIEEREGEPLAPEAHADRSPDPLETLIADERDRALWRAVEALPSGERAAVILYYREQLRVNEVARAVGVSSGTIKTQLHRARNRLRRQLDAPTVGRARTPEEEPS